MNAIGIVTAMAPIYGMITDTPTRNDSSRLKFNPNSANVT